MQRIWQYFLNVEITRTRLNSLRPFNCQWQFSSWNSFLKCVLKISVITFEQLFVIKFCFRFGNSATKTFTKPQQACKASVLSRGKIFRWFKTFSKGRELIKDESLSGRPTTLRTHENDDRILDLMRSNRRLTVIMIGVDLNLTYILSKTKRTLEEKGALTIENDPHFLKRFI